MARSRDYQLTINNPIDHGYTHARIKEIVYTMPSVMYFCMSDEIGLEKGTPHTHLYVHMKRGVEFERMQELFPVAHFELCKGTQTENRNYVFKEGRYAESKKARTRVDGTQYEEGEIVEKYTTTEEKLKANDVSTSYAEWIKMAQEGYEPWEIIEEDPKALKYITQIEKYSRMIKRRLAYEQEHREIMQEVADAEYRELQRDAQKLARKYEEK